jgi:hypothetical protein
VERNRYIRIKKSNNGFDLFQNKTEQSSPADLNPVELNSSVETGALMLCIPQSVAHQLGLEELDKRPVTI